ncbi:hypothetical protein [Atlantibacter sp.]|uniref:hypothetical protein n=1 Tax=Atlantibacter sp. TaxID=1903473 RepID=UPI002899DD57|nr:hypothetical protein [Atlantibacter sp.]
MRMHSLLPLGCLSLNLFCTPAFSASGNCGTIHFVGAIVEEGCEFTHDERRMMVECPVGSTRVKRSIPITQINATSIKSNVPATVKLHYLDDNKKVAIVNVNYQ